ncbi:MAG TPA: response regulator transcription factor [Vicinamibacterales bacterium]|nr:response regulator transcription factor [Acidobacteriota bacterium]HOC17111.1 response regulator transcription factor [Vicinamibacterales bacterium]
MPDRERRTRIVIADDHPIFREGLRRLLEAEPRFQVAGQAHNGLEAVRLVEELRPDVLLLDLAMPGAGGIQALQEIADRCLDVKVILLTAAIDTADSVRVLQLGARGVIMKECATHLLYKCLDTVTSGGYWVGHDRVNDIVQHLRAGATRPPAPAAMLTRRELQIVTAILNGATNKDIGQQFNLSEQTVKNHLSHIFDKVGVSNRLELALYALHHKLVEGARK